MPQGIGKGGKAFPSASFVVVWEKQTRTLELGVGECQQGGLVVAMLQTLRKPSAN